MNRKGTVSVVTYIIVYTLFCFSSASAAPHTLSLTSSGSQSIDVAATAITAISSDSINVSTTCRYGYNFTINTSVNNNNLYLNGDSSNNASGTYFSPVDGTTALNSSTNKWGYYYNSSASNTPTSTSIFSPVPTLNNPATVKTPLATPASSNINDSFKIYYGVNSAPEMKVGTYKMIPDTNNSNANGTIVYTATVAEACTKYTVHFSPTSIFEGNTLSGTGTMNDQTILEGVATSLTPNGFTAPNDYYFAGWNTAQDGSGTQYTDQQQVTDLTSTGSTITLYAMWTDCPGGNICYSPNVANLSDVEGGMSNQPVSNSDTKATLYASNFKRANYGFAAWNTKADGTGVNYGPNQNLEFTAGTYSTRGLKLYARWIENTSNMQNWSGCSNMNIGDVTALKDTRDNNVYTVAKLADGNCWMTENLRLDNTATISSTNTNNPLSGFTQLPATSSSWCNTMSASCVNQSNLNTDNTTSSVATMTGPNDNIYSYGNYYNWFAATAGRGSSAITSGSASGSICPNGWQLPNGKDSLTKSFKSLDIALGGTGNYQSDDVAKAQILKWLSYPNNFIISGNNGSAFLYRNEGKYWTATAGSEYYAYALDIDPIDVAAVLNPGVSYNGSLGQKYQGYVIRCVSSN